MTLVAAIIFIFCLLGPYVPVSIRSLKNGEAEPWKKWRNAIILMIGLIVLYELIFVIMSIYVDVTWFGNLGFASVYWTKFWTRTGLFWVSFVAISAFLLLVVKAAEKAYPAVPAHDIEGRKDWRQGTRAFNIGRWTILPALAAGFAGYLMSKWDTILLYFNQAPSQVTDPIFGKSVSFYMFTVPFWGYVLGALALLFLTALVFYGLAGVFYGRRVHYFISEDDADSGLNKIIRNVWLGAISLLILTCGSYLLARYKLMFSLAGEVFGAGATDLAIRKNMYVLMMVASLACIPVFIWQAFTRLKTLKNYLIGPIALVCLYVLFPLIFQAIVPGAYQKWWVNPTELVKEGPYIQYNMDFTRKAYGIDDVEEVDFPATPDLTREELVANQKTLDNIRIWDWRALKDSYEQLEEIRTYYKFNDVDIDRYMIDGEYRQVMLGARELEPKELKETSKTDVNLRLNYTHGYGLCLNQVNEVAPGGEPNFLIGNIPPESSVPEIQVTRPEIYYGELTRDIVYVKTEFDELDYPLKGEDNAYADYEGTGGIEVGSGFRKLAIAWETHKTWLLLSKYVKLDSRVMLHRKIKQRVWEIAPFLSLENDPYLAVTDEGELIWMIDGYTLSDKYPYSELYQEGLPFNASSEEGKEGFNYIRNSVKITVNAYDGSVTFYVFDPEDPVINTWKNIFPALFKNREDMPADLVRHVRYPEDLLKVQSWMYASYHMKGLNTFYNKEDYWQVAKETYDGGNQKVIPYYVIIKLPGYEEEEFVQMLPMTPHNKNILISWLAGRCDGEYYGKLICYKMPKDEAIKGPLMIESAIDQDSVISGQLTLWGQLGSSVIRGNLLVIPIEDSLIYVEPIYLQAEALPIPQLKMVAVYYNKTVAWAEKFETALALAMSGTPSGAVISKSDTEGTAAAAFALPADMSVIKKVSAEIDRYFVLMGQGKAAEAGKLIEQIRATLNEAAKSESE